MTAASGEIVGPVRVGPVAHGGHCVARVDGRVIFVRHALPGELVRVAITDDSHDRFWRADAVEVLEADPERVSPACPVAGPGGCGGCDLQHVSAAGQVAWKTAVVREQLQRLGGYAWPGEVEAVEPRWGWRTRLGLVTGDDGRTGMRRHRSHDVVPLPEGGCRIAAPDPVLIVDGVPTGPAEVVERAAGRDWRVAADGFWQVHPAAADTLVSAVLEGLEPRAGERAFDLYCGVGLFAGALAARGVRVWGVEYARDAVEAARRNLADLEGVRFSAGPVERVLDRLPARTDLVVLDPPRKGAGRRVLERAVARRPRAIAYVACDPAALGRDLGYLLGGGWRVRSLRAFDLFPQTQHIEAVAILEPGPA